jgi:hypothetical protein
MYIYISFVLNESILTIFPRESMIVTSAENCSRSQALTLLRLICNIVHRVLGKLDGTSKT